MSHPNILEIFHLYMHGQGVDAEVIEAFDGLWAYTNSQNPSEATPIPCPQCFMDGVVGKRGIKTTGVPEGYLATENGKELEYFKCEFCKTRYWKFAEQ
jgi:hypothetical protein